MLTAEAHRKRVWGEFPRLQALLDGRPVPRSGPWTSRQDTDSAETESAELIGDMICGYEGEIKTLLVGADEPTRQEIERELHLAAQNLERAGHWHKREADRCRMKAENCLRLSQRS